MDFIAGDKSLFPEIFALHSQLVQYRKRSGYQIPAAQNDLASKDPVRYKMNLDLCREKRLKAKRLGFVWRQYQIVPQHELKCQSVLFWLNHSQS
jgi:hypothetical protein